MHTGISIEVSPADRLRLRAVLDDRNAAQKHAWRAEIVLLTADGLGTNEVMRRTDKSKTCVWRWQERFVQEPDTVSHLVERIQHLVPVRGYLTLQDGHRITRQQRDRFRGTPKGVLYP
jgi:hypothetical protein